MRWRDSQGNRYRLRHQRLAWPRRIKPEAAFDYIDGGVDDPIALLVSIPGLLLLAVLTPLWLLELVARVVCAPVAAVLRFTGVVPYHVHLRRVGRGRTVYTPTGYAELVRLRTHLRATLA